MRQLGKLFKSAAAKDETGQTLIFIALSLTFVLGFIGFAVDVGALLNARRAVQTAADTAAVAGAAELGFSNSVTQVRAAGQGGSGQNGYTNGANGATVTINYPPLFGPHAGDSSYVEAVVSVSQKTTFMNLFYPHAITVAARAVAAHGINSGCIYTLGSAGEDISMTGSGSITAPTCGIYDDSSSGDAINLVGSATIDANPIDVVGNVNTVGSARFLPNPPNTGVASVNNPLSFLQPPSYSTSPCGAAQNFTGSSPHTLGPGCYDGISNTGSGTLTLTTGDYVINGTFSLTGSGTLNLGAGTYVFNGPLSFTGSSTINGTGVTLYMTSATGDVSLTGSQTLNLSAPTSGPYNGILFYQAPTDNNSFSITGSSGSTLSGIFYLPGAALDVTGSSSATFNTAFVVQSMALTGSMTIGDYAVLNGANPLATTTLVE